MCCVFLGGKAEGSSKSSSEGSSEGSSAGSTLNRAQIPYSEEEDLSAFKFTGALPFSAENRQQPNSSTSTNPPKSRKTGAIVGAASGGAVALAVGGSALWKFLTKPEAIEAQAEELQNEESVYNWDDENDIPQGGV